MDVHISGAVLCVVMQCDAWLRVFNVVVLQHVDIPEVRAAVSIDSFLDIVCTVQSGVEGGVRTSSGITRLEALFFGG